jgi:hypothetical protein
MSTLRQFLTAAASVAVVLTMLGLATGCESQQEKTVTVEDVRNNLSPNFNTVIYSEEQVKNNWAVTLDVNERELRDDWNRMWFLERPQRLTPYPMPY